MPDLFVTGATGCIGRAVIFAGIRAGWSVSGLARSECPSWWPDAAAFIRGDVLDAEAIGRGVARSGAVVHLAAPAHGRPASPETFAAQRRATVNGAVNVARAARARGARLLLVSSIAVYGNPPPAVSNELTEPHPTTVYGATKLEAEERSRAEQPDVTVLRCSVVYGPGDRGNVSRLIQAVNRKRAFVVGDGRNRKSLLLSSNLADRILLVIAASLSGIWCVADSPAPTQRELIEEIARCLGQSTPGSVPESIALAGARAVDMLSGLRGHGGGWTTAVQTLTTPTEVDGSLLDTRLGYSASITMREGIARTVAWLKLDQKLPR